MYYLGSLVKTLKTTHWFSQAKLRVITYKYNLEVFL